MDRHVGPTVLIDSPLMEYKNLFTIIKQIQPQNFFGIIINAKLVMSLVPLAKVKD